jgi:ATP-dependent exoDNAse (exonuclease V) beta subunit
VDAIERRAIDVWIAIMRQPEVAQLLESGERLHELPFSIVLPRPAPVEGPETPDRVLRGTVDCLIRHADGSMTVVEFKTGRARPSHQAQLGIYLRAVEGLFPDAVVTARLIYPVGLDL